MPKPFHSHSERSAGPALRLAALLLFGLCGCTPPSTRLADGRPDGARIFRLYCSGCHGTDGRRGEAEAQLSHTATMTDAEITAIIRGGRKGMPALGERLAPDEIDAVVRHVRMLFPAERTGGAGVGTPDQEARRSGSARSKAGK